MALTRVTQNMLSQRSLGSLQANLNRMAKTQEQLSTGKVINRPSDSPTGTASAMRLRNSLAATEQYQVNGQDGAAWLGTLDTKLGSLSDQTRAARDVALQGANTGTVGQAARDALAAQIDNLRSSMLTDANSNYLGRPVFGGITAGTTAYADGDPVSFVGTTGAVTRTVGEGVDVRVDADAESVFGAAGDTVFEHLSGLSDALRGGDSAAISTAITQLNADYDRMVSAHSDVGARASRIDAAVQAATDKQVTLKASLSDVEDADLPSVIVEMKMQETAYQASLAATARVMQPSLLDFLK